MTSTGRDRPRRIDVLVALAVFAAYFSYYMLCALKLEGIGDFRIHYAAVRELERNFWAPRHEIVAAPASASYAYSPYIRVLSIVARIPAATPSSTATPPSPIFEPMIPPMAPPSAAPIAPRLHRPSAVPGPPSGAGFAISG